SFALRITIKADPQRIYDAWATQQGLESWFLRKAEFTMPDGNIRDRSSHVDKGDAYEWLWFGYGDDTMERREVLEANGKNLLRFVFTGGCLVTVFIKHEHGETIAELKQENIPLEDDPKMNLCLNCSAGWTFYLTNLKSILEGGIDLRNKNDKILNVVNA
ncbi:MAG: SRPBCC domain-containing protein, partial [Cyclobacteriaceae bacterium]